MTQATSTSKEQAVPAAVGAVAAGRWIAPAIEQIDSFIGRILPAADTEPSPLHSAMRYAVFSGGKRLRPLLCLAAAEAVDGKAGETGKAGEGGGPQPCCCSQWPAAAVELVHTYSLIHDDLPCMDDDDFRRGRPSCHKAFGEAIALLAGDALLTMAFAVLSDPEFVACAGASAASACVRELSSAAGSLGMVGGQALELGTALTEGGDDAAAHTVDVIQRLKTGKLFEAAVRMGALSADADASEVDAVTRFAVHFGQAFQIRDDLEDAAEQDADAGVLTSVGVLGAAAAEAHMHELARKAREEAAAMGPGAGKLLSILALTFPQVVIQDV